MSRFGNHIKTFATAIVLAGAAGHAVAQEAGTEIEIAEPLDNRATGPVLPWYRNFTQSSDAVDAAGQALRNDSGELEWLTGDRWGLSFGLDAQETDRLTGVDGVRAGAFFRLTPRVRVGGELGYVARDESPVLDSRSEDSPQVKVESAFRF